MKTRYNKENCKGIGLIEIVIVLLVMAIIVVIALPQLMSSKRLLLFAGMQRETVSSLREARQDAITQRTPITFHYDNVNKKVIFYGGKYGALGDEANRTLNLSGEGVGPAEIIYGRPAGAKASALSDSAKMTDLSGDSIEIVFEADGSVVDGANNPRNNALFFYNKENPEGTAFAVSILGAGGRVKLWRYNPQINEYVE